MISQSVQVQCPPKCPSVHSVHSAQLIEGSENANGVGRGPPVVGLQSLSVMIPSVSPLTWTSQGVFSSVPHIVCN